MLDSFVSFWTSDCGYLSMVAAGLVIWGICIVSLPPRPLRDGEHHYEIRREGEHHNGR